MPTQNLLQQKKKTKKKEEEEEEKKKKTWTVKRRTHKKELQVVLGVCSLASCRVHRSWKTSWQKAKLCWVLVCWPVCFNVLLEFMVTSDVYINSYFSATDQNRLMERKGLGFDIAKAPFTRRRCENDRYEIVPFRKEIRKQIFPDRPPVYTKTIRIRKPLKTIRRR